MTSPPPPLPVLGPPLVSTQDPVEIARAILNGDPYHDADARRLADAYLFLIDDGGDK